MKEQVSYVDIIFDSFNLKRQLRIFTLDFQLWDGALVKQLSSLPNVKRVVSIGTLCAIELMAEGPDAGYASSEFIILKLHLHNTTFRRAFHDVQFTIVLHLLC